MHIACIPRRPGAVVDNRAPCTSGRGGMAPASRRSLSDSVQPLQRAVPLRRGNQVAQPRLLCLLRHACGRSSGMAPVNIAVTIIDLSTDIAVVTTAAGLPPATSIAVDSLDALSLSSLPALLPPPPFSGTWTAADDRGQSSWTMGGGRRRTMSMAPSVMRVTAVMTCAGMKVLAMPLGVLTMG